MSATPKPNGVGEIVAAQRLRPTRCRRGARPIRPHRRRPARQAPPLSPGNLDTALADILARWPPTTGTQLPERRHASRFPPARRAGRSSRPVPPERHPRRRLTAPRQSAGARPAGAPRRECTRADVGIDRQLHPDLTGFLCRMATQKLWAWPPVPDGAGQTSE